MAFEELTKIETVTRAVIEPGARAALVARGRHNGVAELQLSVTLDKLASIGANAESTFAVQIGRDDDVGRIRIKRARTKAVLTGRVAPRGKSVIFNLGLLPTLPRDAVKSEPCAVEKIDEATIEVTLPDFEKLLGLRRSLPPPKPQTSTSTQFAAAPAAKRVVVGDSTAALMGDPAPDRGRNGRV